MEKEHYHHTKEHSMRREGKGTGEAQSHIRERRTKDGRPRPRFLYLREPRGFEAGWTSMPSFCDQEGCIALLGGRMSRDSGAGGEPPVSPRFQNAVQGDGEGSDSEGE